MDAVTRLDTNRLNMWRRLPKVAQFALFGAGGLVALALLFQIFFRYQYLEDNGAVWRVDRLTQEMCQVGTGNARCTMPSQHHSAANSTSLSTSTSISTSITLKVPQRPRH